MARRRFSGAGVTGPIARRSPSWSPADSPWAGAGKTPLALALAELLAARKPAFPLPRLWRQRGGTAARRSFAPWREGCGRRAAAAGGKRAHLGRPRPRRRRQGGRRGGRRAHHPRRRIPESLPRQGSGLPGDRRRERARQWPCLSRRALARADCNGAAPRPGRGADRRGSRRHRRAHRRPLPDPAGAPGAQPIAAAVAGKPVYAFAGIGRPEKFFASLEGAGAVIAGRREFPDHHPFSESEIAEVLAAAAALERDARSPPPRTGCGCRQRCGSGSRSSR